jgi:hypothetical protein
MSKKPSVPLRIAPLQHAIAEIITDPAELAAAENLRKRQKRKQEGRKPKSNRNGPNTTSRSAAKKS